MNNSIFHGVHWNPQYYQNTNVFLWDFLFKGCDVCELTKLIWGREKNPKYIIWHNQELFSWKTLNPFSTAFFRDSLNQCYYRDMNGKNFNVVNFLNLELLFFFIFCKLHLLWLQLRKVICHLFFSWCQSLPASFLSIYSLLKPQDVELMHRNTSARSCRAEAYLI